MRSGSWVSTLLSAVVLFSAAIVGSRGYATEANTFTEFNIPAQNLTDSLEAVALASHQKLLYSSALVKGKSAPALKGQYTLDQAVQRLLSGTDLIYEVSDGLVIIHPKSDYSHSTTSTHYAEWVHPADYVTLAAEDQAPAPPPPQSAPATTAESTTELAAITITGSRVITNGDKSPTPLTVVSMDQLQSLSPGPITNALVMLPQVNITQTNPDIAPQAAFDLRGLAPTRNLILFDGMRVAPGTTNETVDNNLIPQMLLQRVEVVTGGASAVYGSDAVSGVINYVVDNNFNGVKVTGQASDASGNLDHTYNIGIAAGTPLFDGRGHFEVSFQAFNDPGISNRMDLPWGRLLVSEQGSVVGSKASPGTMGNPFQVYTNTRLSNTSFGGLITSGPLAGLAFGADGLAPFQNGAPTGTTTAQIGGGGAYYTAWATPKTDSDQAFARFDWDISDKTKFYIEVPFATTLYVSSDHSPNAQLQSLSIGYDNAYLTGLPAQYQAMVASQLAANPLASFKYSRIFTSDQIPSPVDYVRETQWLPIVGVAGSLGDYQWKVNYEYQNTVTDTSDPYNIDYANLYAALNAIINPTNGKIVCKASLSNTAYANCVPLNPFGLTSVNSAAAQYILADTSNSVKSTMHDVSASISGSPLRDWAGPINVALSAEWRRQGYSVATNSAPTAVLDCAGIQFNCNGTGASTQFFGTTTAAFPGVSENVKEIAVETEVPLMSDLPLVKSFDVNAAARFTDYQTSGGVWTWKGGSTWAINDSLTLRATRSRDIRAPGLIDLYQPPSLSVTTFTDLHTGVAGNVANLTIGNPNLTPEKADTWTGGFIFKPQFIPGAELSIDYYHINISNALNLLSPKQPSTVLTCEQSGGTSPICALYLRPYPFSDTSADNFPTELINEQLNTAGLLTYGADVEMDYAHPIVNHNFSARVLVNYQPHLIYNLGPAGVLDIGGAADGVGGTPPIPNVKAVADFNVELVPNLALTIQNRYRNALRQNGSQLLYFAVGKVPPADYTDLTLAYKLPLSSSHEVQAFLNVKNVADKQPSVWASSGGNAQIGNFGGYAPGDDLLGRVFTIGFSAKL